MTTLSINKLYKFYTYAPSILGASFDKAKLVAILDYNSAIKHKNVEFLQKQVYPFLPASTPRNVKDYVFYKFQTESDSNIIMANYWLIDESTVEITTLNLNVNVLNVSTQDISVIREQLRLLGYTFETSTYAA